MLVHNGDGIVNSIINKLPFEAHIPGYRFCGPGTRLEKRLKRGDKGVNPLDDACKEHDIAYSKSNKLEDRHQADELLRQKAWDRVKSKDAKLGEKATAFFVANVMKAKTKLGLGYTELDDFGNVKNKKIKKKQVSFQKAVVEKVKTALKRHEAESDPSKIYGIALAAARKAVKQAGGKGKIKIPRVLRIPKLGGFIPALIPIFAGLSAVGALAGGAAGIAKTVNEYRKGTKELEETSRHNKMMEAIALGKKVGYGLYLKRDHIGLGLYIHKQKN